MGECFKWLRRLDEGGTGGLAVLPVDAFFFIDKGSIAADFEFFGVASTLPVGLKG